MTERERFNSLVERFKQSPFLCILKGYIILVSLHTLGIWAYKNLGAYLEVHSERLSLFYTFLHAIEIFLVVCGFLAVMGYIGLTCLIVLALFYHSRAEVI